MKIREKLRCKYGKDINNSSSNSNVLKKDILIEYTNRNSYK